MNKVRKVISKYKPYKGTKQKSWSRRYNDRMEKFNRDLQQLTLSHRRKKIFKLMDRLFEINKRRTKRKNGK